MSQHTKEPWHTGAHKDLIVYDKDGHAIASAMVFHYEHQSSEATANARRIVACVNACAGYSTEALEDAKGVAEASNRLQRKLAGLEAQRDELLAALKCAESFISNLRVPQNTHEASIQLSQGLEVLSLIHEAIAKAVQS